MSNESQEKQDQPINSEVTTAKPTLADLLKEKPTEKLEPAKADGKAGENQQKAKPQDLKALAETLKLEDKDLYAIKVPMANGESRSIGDLKDLVGKQDEITARELEFERTKVEHETKIRVSEAQFTTLLGLLPPKSVTPQALEAVKKKFEREVHLARQAIMKATPEWADESKRTAELNEIVEFTRGYGLGDDFLTTLRDPGVMLLIRDARRLKAKVDEALGETKKVPASSTSTSRSSGKAPRKPGPSVTPKAHGPHQGLRALLTQGE